MQLITNLRERTGYAVACPLHVYLICYISCERKGTWVWGRSSWQGCRQAGSRSTSSARVRNQWQVVFRLRTELKNTNTALNSGQTAVPNRTEDSVDKLRYRRIGKPISGKASQSHSKNHKKESWFIIHFLMVSRDLPTILNQHSSNGRGRLVPPWNWI